MGLVISSKVLLKKRIMDSVIIKNKQLNNIFAEQPIDASWVRLIFLAIKKQKLPSHTIFQNADICIKSLNSVDYITQKNVFKLYEQIECYGGLGQLPYIIFDIFQTPFLRFSSHSLFDAVDLSDLLKKLTVVSSQITNLAKSNIEINNNHLEFSFTSVIDDYQLSNVSLEIAALLVVKISNQIFPHISGGVVKLIMPKTPSQERREHIENIPIIYSNKANYSVVFNKTLLKTANIFARNVTHRNEKTLILHNNHEIKLLGDVQNIIREYTSEPSLNIEFVASKLNVSVKTLQRRLKVLNTSFTLLVQRAKVELAMNYLAENNKSIKEIAFELGFNSPSSFTRAFKQWTGTPPSSLIK
jgi:AraC-like DNA-binding protein